MGRDVKVWTGCGTRVTGVTRFKENLPCIAGIASQEQPRKTRAVQCIMHVHHVSATLGNEIMHECTSSDDIIGVTWSGGV